MLGVLVYWFKRCISFIEAHWQVKEILCHFTIFSLCFSFVSEDAMGLNISPSIRQSYISVILDCLKSGKYCEAIMDDLLLFIPDKKPHRWNLEDLLKVLLKNGFMIPPKKCQFFKRVFAIYEKYYPY